MVRGLQAAREGVDEKLQRSRIQLFQARLTSVSTEAQLCRSLRFYAIW